jgi:hypothetical protein
MRSKEDSQEDKKPEEVKPRIKSALKKTEVPKKKELDVDVEKIKLEDKNDTK